MQAHSILVNSYQEMIDITMEWDKNGIDYVAYQEGNDWVCLYLGVKG